MEKLPQLFDEVFQGQIWWSDRDKLSKEGAAWWVQEVDRYRARVYKRAVAHKQIMLDKYNWMMNKFDRSWKDYQDSLEKYRNQH